MVQQGQGLKIGELERKYKIPKMEREFVLGKIKGEKTGIEFEGSFKVKTLTLDDEAQFTVDVDSWIYKASGGHPEGISDGVREYISIKSYLKYAVIDAPEWYWDFSVNNLDMNVLMEIYIQARQIKEKLDEIFLQNEKNLISDKPVAKDGQTA